MALPHTDEPEPDAFRSGEPLEGSGFENEVPEPEFDDNPPPQVKPQSASSREPGGNCQ